MNEMMLNAILNLFSLQAALMEPDVRGRARKILNRYLVEHFRIVRPEVYLDIFDVALELQLDESRELLLDRSRQISAGLKSILPRFEQYVFLLRCLDLALEVDATKPALEPLEMIADELAMDPAVVRDIIQFSRKNFVSNELSERFLLAGNVDVSPSGGCEVLSRPEFRGRICVLRIAEVDSMFMMTDQPGLTLDSFPLPPFKRMLLLPGAIVRDALGNRIYQTELKAFFFKGHHLQPVLFQGEGLTFRYPGSTNGLYDFSFTENSGRMVGIMGGSGSGKSTLLSILTGQLRPDSGRVMVNGLDVYKDSQRLQGVIGYVPQDDLLFEELTVFDNLLTAAGLCMANLSPAERVQKVEAILEELHQPEIRNLQVGSSLEKTISGGQRKRLNIALELIREPSILFVDEPTSGLSSADSENVISLLKAQASKGKLVFVVIHQPSSRIYKMFDSLWILDQGGRPIWDGNPLDAIVHFRTESHQAGMDEYTCPHCGDVNPEQLFEIIEARAVDENGHYTGDRCVTAEAWHKRYLQTRSLGEDQSAGHIPLMAPPEPRLWRPDFLGQLKIFFQRTLKGRLGNRQYLAINLLEPPLLAFLTAMICHGAWGREYSFGKNENLSIYFFISMIVALFMGLSVSAEEICRDRKILKRERFLHLSRSGYIASKALYLILMAALQTGLFTLIGNTLLQIPDMGFFCWLTLFSGACCSSILALNISASFRSAVTIYILIPLILIPQILLGGAVVSFDELMPADAGTRSTPLIVDLMPSRWGYEAMVVKQYVDNRYMRPIFHHHRTSVESEYLADVHIPEIRALADYPLLSEGLENPDESARRLQALKNEIDYIERYSGVPAAIPMKKIDVSSYTSNIKGLIKDYLGVAESVIRSRGEDADEYRLAYEARLKKELGWDGYDAYKNRFQSRDILELGLNYMALEPVRLSGERLVQVAAPICQEVESTGGAHFLAAEKCLGPWLIPTPYMNVLVLWLMSGILYLALYFSWLPKIMGLGRNVF